MATNTDNSKKIKVKIIQPTKIVLDSECDHIIIPGSVGDFGISPGHTPLITTIRPGTLIVYNNSKTSSYALHDGFVTVENDIVRIVCEVVESQSEIDRDRAEKAQKRATERLAAQNNGIDYRRAESALARSMARIQTVTEH